MVGRMKIIVGFLLVGCVSTQVTKTAIFPPNPVDHPIRVYADEEVMSSFRYSDSKVRHSDTLPRSYQVIGSVVLRRDIFVSKQSAVDRAKHDARLLGGDAIILHTSGWDLRGEQITVLRSTSD